jgi:hypothetical protein
LWNIERKCKWNVNIFAEQGGTLELTCFAQYEYMFAECKDQTLLQDSYYEKYLVTLLAEQNACKRDLIERAKRNCRRYELAQLAVFTAT